jgi:hypothetical protein
MKIDLYERSHNGRKVMIRPIDVPEELIEQLAEALKVDAATAVDIIVWMANVERDVVVDFDLERCLNRIGRDITAGRLGWLNPAKLCARRLFAGLIVAMLTVLAAPLAHALDYQCSPLTGACVPVASPPSVFDQPTIYPPQRVWPRGCPLDGEGAWSCTSRERRDRSDKR